jgi:anti-repressor protein
MENNLPETIRLVNGERIIFPIKAQIGDEVVDAILARDLWDWLKSQARYMDWFGLRITQAQLVEDVDFSLLQKSMKQTGRGGHNRKDYVVTVDAAMHMSMLEQTQRGREIRQDLIDWKKKAKAMIKSQPTAINVRDHGQLAEIALQLIEVNKELKEEVAELKPDAEGMRLLRSGNGEFTLTQVAKMLEVKRPWLFDLLTEAGWLYIQNGVHQPYAPLMKQGMLTVDPRKGKAVMRTNGAVEVKVTTLVTPKGLAKITEIVKTELTRKAMAEHEEERAMMERIRAQTDEEIYNEMRHNDAVYGSGDN